MRENRKIKPTTIKKITEIDSEMTEIMKIANKNIKIAIVNMLHIFKKVEEKQYYDEDRNKNYKKNLSIEKSNI